jgi:hypothetical protein
VRGGTRYLGCVIPGVYNIEQMRQRLQNGFQELTSSEDVSGFEFIQISSFPGIVSCFLHISNYLFNKLVLVFDIISEDISFDKSIAIPQSPTRILPTKSQVLPGWFWLLTAIRSYYTSLE